MTRQRLPNRRLHELVDFRHGGVTFTAGIGRFADGRLAEVFLTGSKVGTAIDTSARDSAVVASLALQHGADVATLRRALMRNPNGTASGPLGALLDLLAATCSAERFDSPNHQCLSARARDRKRAFA
jgi:ribonucleoside-diphosphate reductase alpha chain